MPKPPEPQSLILIIDDSVDAIRLLSGMLKDMGQILFATNGAAGIELARQRHPQLILLDVEMQAMDGYEVCRRLKADKEMAECAVIFVTAQSTIDSEIAALEAGAVDFITKPLNAPVVRARVRTHLKLQRATAALVQLANKDGLTGLFNRRYFDEQLGREFQRHKRQGLPLSLAFIDIDCFKSYNDHYGHQRGDACLTRVAELIEAATQRPSEVVARYGGEEFVVLLPYTDAADAAKYGAWLCERVAGEVIEHGRSSVAGHVSVSVGLASLVPDEHNSALALVAEADRALYQAKAAGRNRAVSA
ncbi:diguanylate cyclase [Janthinobacterium sp.]|uniref:diguanylate cyclase n=1 Tax=Janthinobacterium sp. TaxID=1871054 RepID=UPI00293D4208|nr:diguanylate cyclase [Janthinobacterium sp.]